jgi:hypothetical protein
MFVDLKSVEIVRFEGVMVVHDQLIEPPFWVRSSEVLDLLYLLVY